VDQANVCGYKLVKELGARALPAYAAVAPKARRPEDALCVVEKLDRDASVEAEAAAIFMRDAKRLSQVRHPNLVHVREVVVQPSLVLLVTNWVDGEVFSDVAHLAAEQAIPIPLAGHLRIVVDLLEGLSALHEVRDAKREPLNIVHAEVAPRNVVVGIDGRAVLVHPLRPPGKSGKEPPADVVGYLAPEVLLADQTADQRADVYGAGVFLWEALTGRRMHAEGEDKGAVVMRLLGGHVEAPTAPIDAPWAAPLAEVAKKAVSPDPTARYANATEMLAAVRRAVVARLAPKLTVAALVEAVAGDRIRARNEALGYVRPSPPNASRAAPAPVPAVPLDPDATKPPPSVPPPPPSGKRLPSWGRVRTASERPVASSERPAAPITSSDAPPGTPTPLVSPADVAGSLTVDDRTPLRTVDPVTGEERAVFPSDPPSGLRPSEVPISVSLDPSAPPSSLGAKSEPPSADVIEVVEMEVPPDKPSRPMPHKGSAAPPRPPPPAVPRPPPLPAIEPTSTQSSTDMGAVARAAVTTPPSAKARWGVAAATAIVVGAALWLIMRPAPAPEVTSTPVAASVAPTAAPPPPAAPPPSASAAPPAPSSSVPANAPGPFDPAASGDDPTAARRQARAPDAPIPAARPAAAPPPAAPAASSTRGKKRVYDPMGI
jgi:serine/threonine-protein kinase